MKKIKNIFAMKNLFIILMFYNTVLLFAQNDNIQIELILNAKKVRSQICFPKIDLKTMNCIINHHSDTAKIVLSISNELLDSSRLPGIAQGPILRRHLVLKNQKRFYKIQLPIKNIINCNFLIFEFEDCLFYFKKVISDDIQFELFLIKGLSKDKENYGCCDKKYKRKDVK